MRNPMTIFKLILGGIFALVGLPFFFVGIFMIGDFGLDWVNCLVFLIIGLVFSAVGIGVFSSGIRNILQKKKLRQNGIQIQGIIEEVVQKRNVQINGYHPFEVHCSWLDAVSGTTYHFKSEYVMWDPTPWIQEAQIETITVYLDPKNIKRYYIAVDELKGRNGVYL